MQMSSFFVEIKLDGQPLELLVRDETNNAIVFKIKVIIDKATGFVGVRQEDKSSWKQYIISVSMDTQRDDVLVFGVTAVGSSFEAYKSLNSIAIHADIRHQQVVKIAFNVATKLGANVLV